MIRTIISVILNWFRPPAQTCSGNPAGDLEIMNQNDSNNSDSAEDGGVLDAKISVSGDLEITNQNDSKNSDSADDGGVLDAKISVSGELEITNQNDSADEMV